MITNFRPRLRSRHPSHSVLRPEHKALPLFPFKSVIRFGSSTNIRDTASNGGDRIEINTVRAVRNSSNKLLMKQLFTENGVATARWWNYCPTSGLFFDQGELGPEEIANDISISYLPFPIVSKHVYGSRGTGNKKHNDADSLSLWLEGRDTENYIFEKFYNYVREYRLHVTQSECFYTCRKMLKRDTPEDSRWYRNDDHCVWILEENESFDKPSNWDDIVHHSCLSLKAVGLDVGAIDVKVQSATKSNGDVRDEPKFIILETNSAPSFGEKTAIKYIEELPKLLTKKYNENE